MLNKFYLSIKAALSPATESLNGDIEWFNDQYSGVIAKAPVVYVEFPEAQEVSEVSKNMTRVPVNVRLHVVSKVITKVDNTVPDVAISDHEMIARGVRDVLRGLILTQTVVITPATEELPAVTQTNNISEKLLWTKWQHNHQLNGWMVTYIDFVFRTTDFSE